MNPTQATLAGACALWLASAAPALAKPADATEPVAMDGLVADALKRVPVLTAAQANARAQHERVGVAAAPYLPNVQLGAGYARGANVPPAPFGSAPGDGGTANLTLRQELFNFGQTDAAVEAASAGADASDAQVRALAIDVGFNVRSAYLSWVQARGLARSAQEQLTNSQKLLDQANSFFRNGVRPRIDVTRAQVVVANARASLADARNGAELARRSLETAIGDVPVTGEPYFPGEPPIATWARQDLNTFALKHHPQLALSDAQLRVARATTKGADRARLPDLSANAIGGARAQELAFGPDWQVGLNLAVPVFTGFALDKQVAAARENQTAAEASLRDRQQQVSLGVDRAVINLKTAREKLSAFKAELRSARENFDLAQHRYREGVGSIIEVSEAQALLATAEADDVRGQAAVHQAIAQLQDAVGLTGLEKMEGLRP